VPGGGGGERGVGADGPQQIGAALVKPDALVQQASQARCIGPGFDQLAFQLGEVFGGGSGGGQVGGDLRVLTAGVEVVEAPLRQGVGIEWCVHAPAIADGGRPQN